MSLTDEALPDFDLDDGEDETDACLRRAIIADLMTMEDDMTSHEPAIRMVLPVGVEDLPKSAYIHSGDDEP